MIAAGLGCRSGCSLEDVCRALTQALGRASRDLADVMLLCSAHFKSKELVLERASAHLAKQLMLLSEAELAAHAQHTLTSSPRVAALFQVPSIAETAALAGAFELGGRTLPVRLLCARQVAGGATCALAIAGARGAAP